MKKFLFIFFVISILFSNSSYSFEFFTSKIDGTPAIDSNGTIYAGIGAEGTFYTIDTDGSLKWKLQLPDSLTNSSPVYDEKLKTIYIGNGKYLYAISSDGNFKWRFYTEYEIYSTPAIGYDHTIYVPVSYKNKGKLFALSPEGSLIWVKELKNAVVSSPAIDSNQNIYFAIRNNGIISISPDGETNWEYNSYDIMDSSPAISDDGTIYIGGDYLYAINKDGTLKWKFKLGTIGTNSSPVIGKDGTIYIIADKIYAINPDGTLKWQTSYESNYIQNSAPAVSNENIVFIYTGKYLYSFDNNGNLRWKKELGFDSYGYNSPKLTLNGEIVLNTNVGNLYKLIDNISSNNFNWPMFHSDSFNTGRKNSIIALSCDKSNLFFCKNKFECENNNGHWCNTYCSKSPTCLITETSFNKQFDIFFQKFPEVETFYIYKNYDFNLTICVSKKENISDAGLLYIAFSSQSGFIFITKPLEFKLWDGTSNIDKSFSHSLINKSTCLEILKFKVPEDLYGSYSIYAVVAKDNEPLNENSMLSDIIVKHIFFNKKN